MEENTDNPNRNNFADATEIWYKKMKELVEKVGAKEHNIQVTHNVLFGVPLITNVSLDIKFKNGRVCGISDRSFPDAFKRLTEYVTPYKE